MLLMYKYFTDSNIKRYSIILILKLSSKGVKVDLKYFINSKFTITSKSTDLKMLYVVKIITRRYKTVTVRALVNKYGG